MAPKINGTLTLLRDVCLEICDMTNECLFSPFPATNALQELLAVSLKEFIVSA